MRQTIMLIALAGLFLSGSARAQQPKSAGTRIGVIDLAQVYEKNGRFQHLRARIRVEVGKYEKDLHDIEDLKELCRETLRDPNMQDEEREKNMRKLVLFNRGRCGGEFADERYREVLMPLLDEMVAIDEEITRKVKSFAVAEGFDLILSRSQGPSIDDLVPWELLERRFRNRQPRPVAKRVSGLCTTDVTEQFLKKENAQ